MFNYSVVKKKNIFHDLFNILQLKCIEFLGIC